MRIKEFMIGDDFPEPHMERPKINQTVRECLIKEVGESRYDLITLTIDLDFKHELFLYCRGDESALNGEQIQSIFDYLNK